EKSIASSVLPTLQVTASKIIHLRLTTTFLSFSITHPQYTYFILYQNQLTSPILSNYIHQHALFYALASLNSTSTHIVKSDSSCPTREQTVPQCVDLDRSRISRPT
ncbi:hypothetical protein OTU49_010345, partial [Cherax quadricarinatus]